MNLLIFYRHKVAVPNSWLAMQPALCFWGKVLKIFQPSNIWIKPLTGTGCSKLTTSLVNVSLKFQTLISEICQYFCWKNVWSFCSAKASLIFSTKNISIFSSKVVKHLTSWPLNELVKLTMLWTTGPWSLPFEYKANQVKCIAYHRTQQPLR